MNDQTAQDPTSIGNSYVDEYVPPTVPTNQTQDDSSRAIASPQDQITDDEPLSDDTDDDSEDIETQNIFFMLGVEEGDEDLKEKFLDQLQEVIWDDFLSNDVQLLLSQEEQTEFKTYKDKVDSSHEGAQEKAKDEMVEYLEKLIPDLEDIMLEKALDLKADLFVERINNMKEYFAQKPQTEKIAQAEQYMFDDKWKSAAEVLNSIEE